MRMEHVARLQPEVFEAMAQLMTVIWEDSAIEPEILELGRLRMAKLAGSASDQALRYATPGWTGAKEDRVEQLEQWPTAPLFSPRERAALRFAEEFTMDPRSISDRSWQELGRHFGDEGSARLTMAFAVLAEFQRLSVALALEPAPIAWSARIHAHIAHQQPEPEERP